MKKNPTVFLIIALLYCNAVNSQCTPISSSYFVSDRSVTAPASTSFIIAATGTSITYQWQYSSNGGSTWNNASGSPYSGGTSSTLTINPTSASMNGYRYRCSLVNSCTGITYTNWATLTVSSPCTPISSSYFVSDRSVTAPASTSFSIAATGTSITYQWQYSSNGGSTWNNASGSPYSGGTSSTLTINPTSASLNGYKYRCSLVNSCTGIAYTNWATLTELTSVCIQASLTTAFNGVQTIYTDLYQPNNYRLRDNCQTATIRVQDWNSATDAGNPVEITSSANTWTTQNQRFGGSVLWASKQAYDYFLNIHSRSSYNNTNGLLEGYANAVFVDGNGNFYTDNASMTFVGGIMKVGLGSSGMLNNSLCPLDIIGHEYTHAVTGSSAELQYQYESGALNESFSDIFGETVENYILGSNDWLIGADRTSGAIRSMSNPNDYGHPDTYLSTNPNGLWYTGTGDYGGVHMNSGVQNYWFYLLAYGGNGINDNGYSYSVAGIGIVKARTIAYRNLVVYLTSTSGYSDARMGSIQAAEDLYGINSTESNAVKNAWCAVGLGSCATCNTPAAVNVSGGGIFCNSAILTASGGTGGMIYWQGTTGNGMLTTTQTTSQVVTSSGTYYFRAFNSCGVWGPQGSAVVTINTSPNNWTGAVSTAWENAANWSCGVIPDGNTDVIINMGTVIVNSNAFCRTLTVMPGVSFTVNSGFNLAIMH